MSEKETSPETRKSALESDYAALYAVAGLTDALAEALKGALADTQQKASKRLNELQGKRPELSQQAKSGAEDVRTFVITLPEQFKHLPEATKARIAELQKQANDLLAQATSAYGDYAGRGKQAVDEVRKSSRDRSNKTTKPVTPRSPDQGSPDQGSPDQGSPDQGGFDQGSPDQGGFDQGSPDQGGFDQGSPDQGGFDQGSPDQGGFDQGSPDQGGFDQGSPDQGGFDQGSPDQGGFDQGSPDQGGFDQGSSEASETGSTPINKTTADQA